jgi:hypothetical protein
VTALLRAGRVHEAREELERLVLEGLDSGPGIPADEHFWKQRVERLEQMTKARRDANG